MNRKEAALLAKKNKIIGKNHTKGSFAQQMHNRTKSS
jgi:hypothetical protein